jgi:hypothetical protein
MKRYLKIAQLGYKTPEQVTSTRMLDFNFTFMSLQISIIRANVAVPLHVIQQNYIMLILQLTVAQVDFISSPIKIESHPKSTSSTVYDLKKVNILITVSSPKIIQSMLRCLYDHNDACPDNLCDLCAPAVPKR